MTTHFPVLEVPSIRGTSMPVGTPQIASMPRVVCLDKVQHILHLHKHRCYASMFSTSESLIIA